MKSNYSYLFLSLIFCGGPLHALENPKKIDFSVPYQRKNHLNKVNFSSYYEKKFNFKKDQEKSFTVNHPFPPSHKIHYSEEQYNADKYTIGNRLGNNQDYVKYKKYKKNN